MLTALEHELVKAADDEARGWAVYLMRICTPGFREYYFYAAEHVALGPVRERLQRSFDYKIEYADKADPHWTWYKEWLQREKAARESAD